MSAACEAGAEPALEVRGAGRRGRHRHAHSRTAAAGPGGRRMRVKPRSRIVVASAIAVLAFPPRAHADPDDYVHLPAVEYGEREIELRFGTASPTDDGQE